ncbi:MULTISPECIES: MgtC/SapB family protein [Mycobacterium]|nr:MULTISPECIES: MgtC/SapB family protein [Mycobacterium]
MRGNESGHSGPSALWVMAGATTATGNNLIATPLPVVITAAGLVSGIRPGPEATRGAPPQVAQWNAIRSTYRDVADWIDNDAAGAELAAPDVGLAGRMSAAGVVDYLGLVDDSADADRWLSTKPEYWVTAGASVDAASMAVATFRRDYRVAAVIGPITVYRRRAAGSQA